MAVPAPLAPDRIGRLGRLVAGGGVTRGLPMERPLRRFEVTGELSASQAIEEDRAER